MDLHWTSLSLSTSLLFRMRGERQQKIETAPDASSKPQIGHAFLRQLSNSLQHCTATPKFHIRLVIQCICYPVNQPSSLYQCTGLFHPKCRILYLSSPNFSRFSDLQLKIPLKASTALQCIHHFHYLVPSINRMRVHSVLSSRLNSKERQLQPAS